MDNVYIVFAGENYTSHNPVSVHATLHSARAAARDRMEKDEDIAVDEYKINDSGLSWTAKSGHYVAIEMYRLVP